MKRYMHNMDMHPCRYPIEAGKAILTCLTKLGGAGTANDVRFQFDDRTLLAFSDRCRQMTDPTHISCGLGIVVTN